MASAERIFLILDTKNALPKVDFLSERCEFGWYPGDQIRSHPSVISEMKWSIRFISLSKPRNDSRCRPHWARQNVPGQSYPLFYLPYIGPDPD